LDRFITEALGAPGVSRRTVQRAIAQGLVRVNGLPAKDAQRLAPGQVVEVLGLPIQESPQLAPEPIPLQIVYEDDSLAVVDKPRGLVVHPAAGTPSGTLVNALLARYGEMEGERGDPGEPSAFGSDLRPGIVHRLDKDTTGLLVVARTAEAGAALRRQIAVRDMSRRYLALVRGRPPAKCVIDAPIGRGADRKRMVVTDRGRPARTHIQRLEQYSGEQVYALVEARLETGRTHQIRVHMAFAGHPVAGDVLYGQPERDRLAGLELAGQALHAYRLEFEHPLTGERVRFDSPLPPDFAAALEMLRARGGTRDDDR
jgi:23S rRNA pseudouridine1911/1915/1917 synthase